MVTKKDAEGLWCQKHHDALDDFTLCEKTNSFSARNSRSFRSPWLSHALLNVRKAKTSDTLGAHKEARLATLRAQRIIQRNDLNRSGRRED